MLYYLVLKLFLLKTTVETKYMKAKNVDTVENIK